MFSHLKYLLILATGLLSSASCDIPAYLVNKGGSVASLDRPGQPASGDHLKAIIAGLTEQAKPGVFAIEIEDVSSGKRWSSMSTEQMPMLSDFKAVIAAVTLSQVQEGRLSLRQTLHLKTGDYVPGSAKPSLGAALLAGKHTASIQELLKAAVSESANTSVDALLHIIGGPAVATAFLRQHGIVDMTVMMNEREMSAASSGNDAAFLGSTFPSTVGPEDREKAGYTAFVAHPPNVTTAQASAVFLQKLFKRDLLHEKETRYLLSLMEAQTVLNRLRDGVPAGILFADKTGTGSSFNSFTSAYNDMGLIVYPHHHCVIVVGLFKNSPLPSEVMDQLFRTLAQAVVAETQHETSR